MGIITILEDVFSPGKLLKDFTESAVGAGAVASFTGLVRADENTKTLTLSHYEGFTNAVIKTFADTAMQRWSLNNFHIHHRVGSMQVGEAIVFVATSAAHRRDAFDACDYLMDCLKSDAPFWKQENGEDWIEPRAADYADKKRWSA